MVSVKVGGCAFMVEPGFAGGENDLVELSWL